VPVKHRIGFVRGTLVVAALVAVALPARTEEAMASVDDLLSNGWRHYSEELDFEAALASYDEATQHPDATDEQLLEALEYVAACRFALGDHDGARGAMEEMLHIDRAHTLTDPSHSPDFLQMLEDLRGALPPEPPEAPATPPETEAPPHFAGGGANDGDDGDDAGGGGGLRERERRPFYRTWWFWTLTAAVVVGAGVGLGVGLGTSGAAEEPPAGSLDPGVVQLPCFGRHE
jgi:tetratricopeptide (TPR) repeat protein